MTGGLEDSLPGTSKLLPTGRARGGRSVVEPAVRIKGSRAAGLSLDVRAGVQVARVIEELHALISRHRQFFEGAKVSLNSANEVDPALVEALERAAAEYGMRLVVPRGEGAPARPRAPAGRGLDHDGRRPDLPTRYIRRTLRSGQREQFDGHVVIVGDVNPGAEVVATGDIVVMGKLRGMAHAGARGDPGAVVVAFRLEPTQLRIGDLISRSPDGTAERTGAPEIAEVQDGRIVVRHMES